MSSIEVLPQAALDWIPGPVMNSINALVVHINGAERYWIGDVAAQEPSERDREAEFKAHGLNTDALRRSLFESLDFIERVLENMDLQELEKKRISSRDGLHFTVGWALLHTLEHTAIHVGHIQITSQMWKLYKEGDSDGGEND